MSLINKITNESIQKAIEIQMQTKGRLFEIDPQKPTRTLDLDLMKEASKDASDNVARSLFAPLHDDAAPIFKEMQQSVAGYLEKNNYNEDFIHFVKNYALTSADVLDLISEYAEEDGVEDGEK